MATSSPPRPPLYKILFISLFIPHSRLFAPRPSPATLVKGGSAALTDLHRQARTPPRIASHPRRAAPLCNPQGYAQAVPAVIWFRRCRDTARRRGRNVLTPLASIGPALAVTRVHFGAPRRAGAEEGKRFGIILEPLKLPGEGKGQ
ncbi:hypothetical protein E2C01_062968 [Portunus trituberculatus]|uniref:Uncharacterized protein n=1 Tax=Portunus trituberculatus TaxID=210409 RepID=A0A5B7HJ05_PORTR|nr:hypothetical protein [Portunus trituberculatus]